MRGKAGIELFDQVGFAISIGVFRVKDVGGGANQYAFAPGHHAGGKWYPIQKECGLIIMAGAISVLKEFYAATGLAFAIETGGVVVHFTHPQFAIRPKVNRHRIDHERLRRDQLDLQVRFGAKRCQRFPRAFGRWKLGFLCIEKKLLRHDLMHCGDDALLHFGTEAGRPIIVPKRFLRLISAFPEHTSGGDVARHIVGVSCDPEAA